MSEKIEKIKVFISYHWATDQNFRAAVASNLKQISNVEVIIDTECIAPIDNIHQVISEKLDQCDCVMVSTNSFDSKEVLSELIRAHERSKEILLIEQRNDRQDVPPHLHFLNDKLRFRYNDIDDLIYQLRRFFENKDRSNFEVLPSNLRLLQKEIRDLRDLPRFRAELITRILSEALKEIKEVKDQDKEYRIDVGIEKNFLVRARSIFENANKVYAISTDSVSTFWTNEKNKSLAHNYIQHQPNNTIRLFVFSSFKTANKYRQILQASHNSYGQNGRVLICSLPSYMYLLEMFSNLETVNKYLNQDFGILIYNTPTGEQHIIEALLDHSELKFKKIDLNLPGQINYKELLSYFENFINLDFEKVFKYQNGQKKIYVKRWNPDCVTNNYLWQTELKELFPEERSGDVYHLVFFKDRNGKLEEKILEIKGNLNNLQTQMKIKFLWFGKTTEKTPLSDLEYGKLKLSFDYDYLLMMRFDSYDDLRIYYTNKDHSYIRKNLYKSMHEGLDMLYEYLDKIKEQEPDRVAKIFEMVEDIVSNYMIRADFVDKEDIDSIVKELPYSFPFMFE